MDSTQAISILQNDPDSEKRREAIDYLILSRDYSRDVLYALAIGLEDPDDGIKDLCCRILANIPKEYADNAGYVLAPLITHENIEIRNLAGDILLNIGTDAVKWLTPYLGDSDRSSRQFAVELLGKIGDPSAADEIARHLGDSDLNFVNAAIEALGKMKAHEYIDDIAAMYSIEDFKPTIIEAIGRMCSPKSQEFLLQVMKSEEDPFYRLAAIDALATCGDDIEICTEMISQMASEKEELQLILLRTVYAISSRVSEFLELPDGLRHVAQKALFDHDIEMRNAGIVALGSYYIDSDIPGLVNEAMRNNSTTQRHILLNLLANSGPLIVSKFFVLYCSSSAPDGTDIEFFSHLPSLWPSVAEENKRPAIESIINVIFTFPKGYSNEIIEILAKVEYDMVLEELRKILQSDNTEYVDNAMDIIHDLKLKELSVELTANAFQSKRLTQKATEIAVELNR